MQSWTHCGTINPFEKSVEILFTVIDPQNAMEKKLIGLDIKEKINFPEGHLVQKGSEMRAGDFLSSTMSL